ncbi:MAG: hypothetical protein K0U62_11585 [Actinomycetia bacterium]|nr:hypothetical protein [Actinomycetes bacterium]
MSHRLPNPFLARPESYRGGTSIGVEEYPGFHTAGDREIALAYAYAKTPPPPTVREGDFPVLIGLDMRGYERLLDYDAVISLLPVVQTMLEEAPTLDDWYEILEISYAEAEVDFPPSAAAHAFQVALSHIIEGGGIDPDSFADTREYTTFRDDILNLPGNNFQGAEKHLSPFTRKVLMGAVQQYRYLDDVPEERVVSVEILQPMWDEILRFDEDEKVDLLDDLGWNLTHEDDVAEFSVPIKVLVDFEWPRNPGARIEYHGTSLYNLLAAAPGLREDIEPSVPQMPEIPEL